MQLDLIFSALSDPTRRAILAQLGRGEASVQDLAAPYGLKQPTISKHLKVLEQAGLIEVRVDGTSRPRRLVPAPLQQVDDWLATFRSDWQGRLDNLQTLLAQEKHR